MEELKKMNINITVNIKVEEEKKNPLQTQTEEVNQTNIDINANICQIRNYLTENYNPHCKIVITPDGFYVEESIQFNPI